MNRNRIEGFDYLRTIMSICVVALHMKVVGHSSIFSEDGYSEHTFTLSDFVHFHILLLAVPTFIYMSTFLYALKGASRSALTRRFKRILILLTFWPIGLITFYHGFPGLVDLVPHSIGSFIVLLLCAGNTVYYFFVCLLLCLLETHVITKLKVWAQVLGLVLSTVLVAVLPIITRALGLHPLCAYWNPLNFIAFPFAAVLLAGKLEFAQAKRTTLVIICVILCVLFSLLEWKYAAGKVVFHGSEGPAIPPYARDSLLFGTLAAVLVALNPAIRSSAIVRCTAKYALAVYCLHPFLMGAERSLLAKISQSQLILNYGALVLVVLSCYAAARVLQIYLRDEVIV